MRFLKVSKLHSWRFLNVPRKSQITIFAYRKEEKFGYNLTFGKFDDILVKSLSK